MNIAIIHPDLGIGGAERLIVDAAVELASQGHNVHVFTSHHDKSRCFEETLSGIFQVTVYGSFLPRHIFYRLHAVCAYLRCLFVALCVLLGWSSFDVVLADQVSVVVPLLKLKRSSKVVFYCHFPDLLLAKHTTALRRMYWKPIDFLEEQTTGMADMILVNSNFTASTFAKTFKRLHARGSRPAVLYPAVNVDQFIEPHAYKLNFLSINRFEKKKNIDLAVSAFAILCKHKLTLSDDVTLTVAAERNELLSSCLCVLYTPTDEHFGIVPLGAMAKFVEDPELARGHVVESFSVKTFGEKLNQYLVDVVSSPKED
ncbi:BnaC03g70540D [Brassica napus]|uniref:Alpha-1,3/1,6-mannosyltransferase ALG2 n=1 Tax=Brassica napus TaxID=3708 RepID=A0A078F800_BRANA|nr:BnaC03g70540D [Brassica napus]